MRFFLRSTILIVKHGIITLNLGLECQYPKDGYDYRQNYQTKKQRLLEQQLKLPCDREKVVYLTDYLLPCVFDNQFKLNWHISHDLIAEPLEQGQECGLHFKDVHLKTYLTILGFIISQTEFKRLLI